MGRARACVGRTDGSATATCRTRAPRAWAEIATADDDDAVDPEIRKDAAWALAERRFDRGPGGMAAARAPLAPGANKRRKSSCGSIALAAVVVLAGIVALNRGWDARNGNPRIAISGWAAWNYSGYERRRPRTRSTSRS